MAFRTPLFSTAALLLLSTAAHADVTAQNIWQDWKDYMGGFGYQVTSTEAVSGNTLTVSDISTMIDLPDGSGSFKLGFGEMTFTENSDGTVTMTIPAELPMAFEANIKDEGSASGVVLYKTENFTMIASGDPDVITYDYSADTLGLSLSDLVVDGQSIGSDVISVNMTTDGLKGTSVMRPGELRTISQTMSMGNADYAVKFLEPGGENQLTLNGQVQGLSFNGTSSIPMDMDPEDMAKAMEAGFAIDGGFSNSGSNFDFMVIDNGDQTQGNGSTTGSSLNVTMNKDNLAYSGKSNGVKMEMMGGDIPFPVMLQLGEAAFNLAMPVSKTDAPADFAFGLTLADFVTSDMIWSMFDPGQVLPRDPATISVDLSGKAKMLFDVFDAEQMAELEKGDTIPAELNALTLNKLLVSVAGAELTGEGAFTFDNSDMTSFDGLPKPTGGVEVQLVGGNGLIDKLVQMGLLPEEQAMGARMMMGMFARPGAGEDTLTSALEVNEQGHVLANGQRIK